MTYTALFLDREQKIRVNVFPERPVKSFYAAHYVSAEHEYLDALEEYEAALQSALDTGILCEDQNFANALALFDMPDRGATWNGMQEGVLYPISDYRMEVKEVECDECIGTECRPGKCNFMKKLATLKPI